MHLIEDTLTHFQYVSQPNSNLNYRKYAKTVPNCFLAKFQSHLIEKIRGLFQIVP